MSATECSVSAICFQMPVENCSPVVPPLVLFPVIILPAIVTTPILCPSREEVEAVERCCLQYWAQPLQSLLKLRVQHVPCCLFLRNTRVGFSLFLSKTVQQLRRCFVVFSFSHRNRLKIWITTLHHDSILVTIPLVSGCVVGDVDRSEVVQTLAINLIPPDR